MNILHLINNSITLAAQVGLCFSLALSRPALCEVVYSQQSSQLLEGSRGSRGSAKLCSSRSTTEQQQCLGLGKPRGR